MIRFLADEDFNQDIIAALVRRTAGLDITTVQRVGLTGSRDLEILEFAARENRILLTHDGKSMVGFAAERLMAGLPLPGIFHVHQQYPVQYAIDELVLVCECSEHEEWTDRIIFLPL